MPIESVTIQRTGSQNLYAVGKGVGHYTRMLVNAHVHVGKHYQDMVWEIPSDIKYSYPWRKIRIGIQFE